MIQKAYKNYYSKYKAQAKRRGRPFSLELDLFIQIVSQDCFYCGVKPKKKTVSVWRDEQVTIYINGIDRKDNKLGYTIKNCVPCCSYCNNAKKDLAYKTFINHAIKLGENLKNKN